MVCSMGCESEVKLKFEEGESSAESAESAKARKLLFWSMEGWHPTTGHEMCLTRRMSILCIFD